MLYNTPQEQPKGAGFVPSWCSVTKTEAKPSTGTRQACEPQAERVSYTNNRQALGSTRAIYKEEDIYVYPISFID